MSSSSRALDTSKSARTAGRDPVLCGRWCGQKAGRRSAPTLAMQVRGLPGSKCRSRARTRPASTASASYGEMSAVTCTFTDGTGYLRTPAARSVAGRKRAGARGPPSTLSSQARTSSWEHSQGDPQLLGSPWLCPPHLLHSDSPPDGRAIGDELADLGSPAPGAHGIQRLDLSRSGPPRGVFQLSGPPVQPMAPRAADGRADRRP